MTRLVSRGVFYFLYSALYLWPIALLIFAERRFGWKLNVIGFLGWLGVFRYLFYILVVGYVFVLPGYRAKLAADAYGDRDMGSWEAHAVSGAILMTHLRFLSVIGVFFGRKSDDDEVYRGHRGERNRAEEETRRVGRE